MKNVVIIGLILTVIVCVIYSRKRMPYSLPSLEGFEVGQGSPLLYEDAHGSAPAGVNASPGYPQYKQNADSPHVNPAYRRGNPQNTMPGYKNQPNFYY